MAKSYLIIAELVPEQALDPDVRRLARGHAAAVRRDDVRRHARRQRDADRRLGQRGSVGICAAEGRRVSFVGFMRYGVPVVIVQLAVSALYVLALDFLIAR